MDNHKFINDMLHFASAAESPELVINQILQYIGENSGSDRAYIFEEDENGYFANTYEWCREGVSAEKDNLQHIPYEGVIEVWYAEYEKSHNIVIYDIEEYRAVSEALYNILKPQDITSLVTGPIEVNGRKIGFYGVDNPPKEMLDKISSLIDMMEFVLDMMIKLRDYSRKLEKMAVIDQLTKCNNRTALTWAYDNRFDRDKSITVIMCDLNGLKHTNDVYGHLAGDRLICDAANVLCKKFGIKNVYRIGGDEFLVVLLGETQATLENKLGQFKEAIAKEEISMAIGYAFREQAIDSFSEILKEADDAMYNEKEKFYASLKKNY